jgi:Uma2 family endonuclease
MGGNVSTEMRYTIRDLDQTPDDGNLYEIIDGELYVSTSPHWHHQLTCTRLATALSTAKDAAGAGAVLLAPGIIFAEDQAVAPDVVWVRRERFVRVVGDDGKLHAAPDLVVEVLSPGRASDERDRDLKRKLYSRQGVQEYWIVDWREPTVQVYRRANAALQLVATLAGDDELTTPLLPGFRHPVHELCSTPLDERPAGASVWA